MRRRDFARRSLGALAGLLGLNSLRAWATPVRPPPPVAWGLMVASEGQVCLMIANSSEWARRKDHPEVTQCEPPEWNITELEELGVTVAVKTMPLVPIDLSAVAISSR